MWAYYGAQSGVQRAAGMPLLLPLLLTLPAAAAARCADKAHTEFEDADGKEMSCAQLHQYCNHAKHGAKITAACPVTCGAACSRPFPPGMRCADKTHTELPNPDQELPCATLHQFCYHPTYGTRVTAACPVTCGACALTVHPTASPYKAGSPSASPMTPPPTSSPTAGPVQTAIAGIKCTGSYLCGPQPRVCVQLPPPPPVCVTRNAAASMYVCVTRNAAASIYVCVTRNAAASTRDAARGTYNSGSLLPTIQGSR
eukprot:gene19338-biopygen43612